MIYIYIYMLRERERISYNKVLAGSRAPASARRKAGRGSAPGVREGGKDHMGNLL